MNLFLAFVGYTFGAPQTRNYGGQASSPGECDFPCFFIYDPVCGYNGRTYKAFGNSCMMDRSNCLNKNERKWNGFYYFRMIFFVNFPFLLHLFPAYREVDQNKCPEIGQYVEK